MTTETTKPNYKQTLNLPKTDFAMKANLAQSEPLSLKRWEQLKLYERIVASRSESGSPQFTFHDGPPYANSSIHVGHLLNKVLKDLVVRTRLMMGYRCAYIPGWDCHGLPIEHMVMTELIKGGKAEKLASLTDDQRRMAIRRECQKHAEKSIKLQVTQMQRLLTLADYEHPYQTMSPQYEQAVLEAFADLVEQRLVYRALKSVHWSIANQTALAEAELEYYDREDPSIFVDFEVADRGAVARLFGVQLDQTPSFMIWTTTPWTLPANLAIAVNPKFTYALVEVDGNLTIIAKELVERVTKAAKSESVKVLGEAPGTALIGWRYRHPFVDPLSGEGIADSLKKMHGRMLRDESDLGKVFSIVAADYVTLEDGTGLVHTAPGHGEEDYQTGLRENLGIYCPVLGDGVYDDTVPSWLRGLNIWDANPRIVDRLRESGHLFFDHKLTHSYPHDWRGKSPVIFRATEQWFIGVDRPLSIEERESGTLRSMALRAVEREVQFIPEWGRNRMRGMLESRPDWCISRQRAWGLPIPAFFGREVDQVLLTPASVRAVAKLIGAKGSDIWFQAEAATLLQHYDVDTDPDAPAWVRQANLSSPDALQKSTDIFDVWFESGSSWNAVLRARNLGYPADLYLEGSDQHRGWFQSSLLPALGATGQSPFRALLTHGFIVDKDGRKMSKSLGNTLEVEELLKHFGADVCRWWVSSLAFENDIKMDISFFEAAGETYRKVRNTLRFLLSNLYDFHADTGAQALRAASENPGGTALRAVSLRPEIAPTSLDAYALAAAASIQREVLDAYEAYEFRRANQLLYDFCNDTLSAFYCAAVKDRLYCDRADSPRRRATQAVMWRIMESLCRLLAPILPHTADEAYRSLWKASGGDERSVHMLAIEPLEFEADDRWPAVLAARDAALKALEEAKARGIDNPLDAEVILADPHDQLTPFAADLPDILGVSRVALDTSDSAANGSGISINDLRDEPRCDRCWKRTIDTKPRPDGGTLCDRCADAV